jgi:hypothetical protein
MAIAPDGRTTVVWSTRTGALESVRIAPDGTPGPVVGLATGARRERVAVAGDGAATVTWLEETPGHLDSLKARQIAPNGTLGSTHTLALAGVANAAPVAVAPDRTATVVWEQRLQNGTRSIESVRIAPTGVPGAVQTVSSSGSPWQPELATAPSGATMVIWEESGMAAAEIAPDGTIGAATTIFDDPGWTSRNGLVAFDAAGNATAIAMSTDAAYAHRFDLRYHDAQLPQYKTFRVPPRATRGVRFGVVAVAVDNRGVASMKWDFGDGFTAIGPAPTHTYQRAGVFLVRVTVTDYAGNSASKTQMIVVS